MAVETRARQTLPDLSADPALRADLARAEETMAVAPAVLRHLLLQDHATLFSDDIVARVGAMLDDLAVQLLRAEDGEGEEPAGLARALADDPTLLAHLHARAIEWQVTERAEARLGVDPVLSPLLQALVGADDAATSQRAMALLAAQARFVQAQRRMQLPLLELPGDILHRSLLTLRTAVPEAAARETAIRAGYDEGRSRVALLSRVTGELRGGLVAALSVSHAGIALFASALAAASGQARDTVVLSLHESQRARFALTARAAGLHDGEAEQQLVALHPDAVPPPWLSRIGAGEASALLAGRPGEE